MNDDFESDVRRVLKDNLDGISAPKYQPVARGLYRWMVPIGSVAVAAVILVAVNLQAPNRRFDQPASPAQSDPTSQPSSPDAGSCIDTVIRGEAVSAGRLNEVLHGHVPMWLPSGMRLAEVLEGQESGAVWATDDCRLLRVFVHDAASQPDRSDWTPPEGGSADEGKCFTSRLGNTECWATSRGYGDVSLSADVLGLTRDDLLRIVDSFS
jgi:hypothetical protein